VKSLFSGLMACVMANRVTGKKRFFGFAMIEHSLHNVVRLLQIANGNRMPLQSLQAFALPIVRAHRATEVPDSQHLVLHWRCLMDHR
jgi:hypothetical protein